MDLDAIRLAAADIHEIVVSAEMVATILAEAAKQEPEPVLGGRWYPSDIRVIVVYGENDDETYPYADFTDEECNRVAHDSRYAWEYFVEGINEQLAMSAEEVLKNRTT